MKLCKEDQEAILNVLSYANKNKTTHEKIIMSMCGRMGPVGDSPHYSCKLHLGKRLYRVVFSYEEQKPNLWYRHTSISCLQNMVITDINFILRAFKFRASVPALSLETEAYDNGCVTWFERGAFNVMESVSIENQLLSRDGKIAIAETVGRALIVSDITQKSAEAPPPRENLA